MFARSRTIAGKDGFCPAAWACLTIVLCILQQFSLAAPPAAAPALKGGNARVIFVGDSITGLSRNYPTGFAHQIQWALETTYPGCKPDLVSLGGSGQGVASWRDVEKRSRQQEVFLDVPRIDVKAGLGRPADVVVVMLGMNDVLSPYVANERAALDAWTENYRALIESIKERTSPAIVAVATITPCTEDPASPKNRMIEQMNRRAAALASQLGYRVLRTGEAVHDVLRQGRRVQPDFHVTYDFVHPNEAGHLAIAIAMLRGLGEADAAQRVADQRLASLLKKAAGTPPSLSYAWTPVAGPLSSDRQTYRVRYWWNSGVSSGNAPLRVSLAGDGWNVQPRECVTLEGEFQVIGIPGRRMNLLKLEGTDGRETRRCDVKIPAPWLVATDVIQPLWSDMRFEAAKARTSIDEAIVQGSDFLTKPLAAGKTATLSWQRHTSSVNYTGLDAPGSVDFSGVNYFRNFEGAYGARWIQSPRERPVRLALGVQAFAGTQYLTVYLNGQEVYAGHITGEPRKQKHVDARLRQGWNTLVFKSNHCTWQWQVAVDLAPADGDSLDDLRYSTVPQR